MPDKVGSSGAAEATALSEALKRGRSLVLAAFDEARSPGRAEWYLMTTAVLKNRLLNSTNGEFDEKNFGVSSVVEFARLFPEDLEVDTQSRPPVVRLRQPDTFAAPMTERSSTDRSRSYKKIRPDLWRAVVDYRSGSTYVWDEIAGIARVVGIDDTSPVVPTVTDTEMTGWRQDFADSVRSHLSSEQAVERLGEWLQHGYGTAFLPNELRGKWNEFSRERIEARLRGFFEDLDLSPPDDLVTFSTAQPATVPRSAPPYISTDVPRLRVLVQRCVAVMTEQELTDLRISPAVMLRATRGRS